ncbi:MAG: hypothetical protein AAGL99_18350, partial [Pseudomonadota bacterium]
SYVELAAKREERLRPIGLSDIKAKKVSQKRAISEDAKKDRLTIAREVYAEGGSISEFARRVNINTSWATAWLRNNDADLHKDFLDQRHPITLDTNARIARLMSVKIGQEMGLSIASIARHLNMRRTALCNWLETWAPDGIDDALEFEVESLEEAA